MSVQMKSMVPEQMLTRRSILLGLLALSAIPLHVQAQQKVVINVWKDPNCGCCADWMDHLQNNGFVTKVANTPHQAKRMQLGIPSKYASCHTAEVQGYAIEGHVPAADIKRLLQERPSALGLAVPGMPIGSPGMDGPAYGGKREAYNVLLIQKDGTSKIYSSY